MVCEDVVSTWHSMFKCVDSKLSEDVDFRYLRSCQEPRFSCDKLSEPAHKVICQGMHADWREQEPLRKRLAFSYLESGSPYHTCRKMTKCEERSSAPCKAYVLSEKREFRPTFVVPASVCTPSCYVCQWLVSDWPFFGEYCNALTDTAPATKKYKYDLHPTADDSDSSLIGMKSTRRKTQKRKAFDLKSMADTLRGDSHMAGGNALLKMAHAIRTRADDAFSTAGALAGALAGLDGAAKGLHNLPTSPDDDKALTDLSRHEKCWKMWDFVWRSRKARYFVQWRRESIVQWKINDMRNGNMWDANTVCKCLGKCRMGHLEHLSLIKQCRYGPAQELAMSEAFRHLTA